MNWFAIIFQSLLYTALVAIIIWWIRWILDWFQLRRALTGFDNSLSKLSDLSKKYRESRVFHDPDEGEYFYRYNEGLEQMEVGIHGRYNSLHLTHVPKREAVRLESLLREVTKNSLLDQAKVAHEMSLFMYTYNMRVIEIDEYISDFIGQYKTRLALELHNRESIFYAGFMHNQIKAKERALKDLPMRPDFVDLDILFDSWHKEDLNEQRNKLPISWPAIGLYANSIGNQLQYVRTLKDGDDVKLLEELANAGWADSLNEPNCFERLYALNAFERRRVLSQVEKEEGKDPVIDINLLDSEARAVGLEILRPYAIYRLSLNPPGYKELNIEKLVRQWNNTWQTYLLLKGHLNQLSFLKRSESWVEAEDFIRIGNNREHHCARCLALKANKYHDSDKPILPAHIGCSCYYSHIDE